MQLPLYQNLDNETAAGLTVQALSNASSAEAAAAANSIASQLSSGSSAGLDVQPHDISILQAQLVELGPSNFSIHVSAVISIYYPASVHRGDIIDSKVQTAAGSGSRRALLSTPSSFPATAGAALLWAATSEASSTALETHQGGPPQVAVDANIQAMLSSLRQLAAAVTAEARSVQHSALSRTSTTACSNSNTEGCSASRHTSKGRRLLQATDTGIAAQLTSMTSAASSSLAPVSLTGQQTSAAVDPVVVSTCLLAVCCVEALAAQWRLAEFAWLLLVPLCSRVRISGRRAVFSLACNVQTTDTLVMCVLLRCVCLQCSSLQGYLAFLASQCGHYTFVHLHTPCLLVWYCNMSAAGLPCITCQHCRQPPAGRC